MKNIQIDNKIAAKLLEIVARKSVEVIADSRCMYIFHQPKQPDCIRKLNK